MFNKRTGFDWDEANSLKNWEKHGVSSSECEEVFFNHPLVMAPDAEHADAEVRFFVLGRTNGGRELFVVFTVRRSLSRRVLSSSGMSICQVCGSELDSLAVTCQRCETPHHADCWEYLGGCSTYGCTGRRPWYSPACSWR